MPELRDVLAYVVALQSEFSGMTIQPVSLRSPFVVRTVEPDLFAVEGKRLLQVREPTETIRETTPGLVGLINNEPRTGSNN